jgi:hypothetical protein
MEASAGNNKLNQLDKTIANIYPRVFLQRPPMKPQSRAFSLHACSMSYKTAEHSFISTDFVLKY